ncbi:MAG: beta-lactamase family protein, partial [Actinomycetota bacterium]|nr:beta-lactamase family protein [Actinomycetota bacterium]
MPSLITVAAPVLKSFDVLGWPIAVGGLRDDLAAGFVVAGELRGVPVTEDTKMYAASLTKQLVGALAALATTSGQLDPDASVREVLTELPAWASPVRIRHLVHHTSGLPTTRRAVSALGSHGNSPLGNDDVIKGLAAVDRPERPPGVTY